MCLTERVPMIVHSSGVPTPGSDPYPHSPPEAESRRPLEERGRSSWYGSLTGPVLFASTTALPVGVSSGKDTAGTHTHRDGGSLVTRPFLPQTAGVEPLKVIGETKFPVNTES